MDNVIILMLIGATIGSLMVWYGFKGTPEELYKRFNEEKQEWKNFQWEVIKPEDEKMYLKLSIGTIVVSILLIGYFAFWESYVPAGEYKLGITLKITEASEGETIRENAVASIIKSDGEFYLHEVMFDNGTYLSNNYYDEFAHLERTYQNNEMEIYNGDEGKIETIFPPLVKENLDVFAIDLIKSNWIAIIIFIVYIVSIGISLKRYCIYKTEYSQEFNQKIQKYTHVIKFIAAAGLVMVGVVISMLYTEYKNTEYSDYPIKQMAWIATATEGTKYHRDPFCSNMQNPVYVDIETAKECTQGKCSKCW